MNKTTKTRLEKLLKAPEPTGWVTDVGIVDSCGLCKSLPIATVILKPIVQQTIEALCEVMGKDEWLAYLIGEKTNVGYYVTALHVPKQDVTAKTVEVTGTTPPNTIGTVHSHHTMGSVHSSTDIESIGSNHDVTLVASTTTKWKVKTKLPLPCGKTYIGDGKLLVDEPNYEKIYSFVDAAVLNINVKSYPVAMVQPAVTDSYPCVLCGKRGSFAQVTWNKAFSGWVWLGISVVARVLVLAPPTSSATSKSVSPPVWPTRTRPPAIWLQVP